VILPDGFEVFEGAAFIDVLGWANEFGTEPIEMITAGVSKELRCTFGGFKITPDTILDELDLSRFDAVAIPGGFETAGFYKEAFSEPVLKALREFNDLGKPIASICVGALPVAKSGALNGRRATTYHLSDGIRRYQLSELGAEVLDEPIVVDGNITTSTSPATAVEVAFRLVESLTSKDNANEIRRLMGF